LKPGLPNDEARRCVQTLAAWPVIPIDEALISDAWTVQDRFGFTFWDGLVVAAARASGCRSLLTEDLQHGQDLDGLLVVNPFLQSPDSLESA
jgi:predicted nucleic acid-binding protein